MRRASARLRALTMQPEDRNPDTRASTVSRDRPSGLRAVAWLIAATFVLALQAFSAFDGAVLPSTESTPARADAFGKGMVPVSLAAKPGILRSESGGPGGDDVWALRADAQRAPQSRGRSIAGRTSRVSAPLPNAALVRGARTPTGPPIAAV